MELDSNLLAALFVSVGFLLLFTVMAGMVIWARSRSVGAITAGAIMSVFSPDPTFEQKIQLVEEAKETQGEEDQKGEL